MEIKIYRHLTGHIMLVTANPIVKFNQWLSFSVEISVIGYNAQKLKSKI